MSNPDPAKVLFSSRYKYFLNKDTETGTLSVPATAIAAGDFSVFSLSIPVENDEDYTQIRLNFSHDPSDWYVFPTRDIELDADYRIAVAGGYTSNSLNLTFVVFNWSGSGVTSTATTVTAKVTLFEPPS